MDSPGAILTRLQALSGYEWDTELPPFHSSYGMLIARAPYATNQTHLAQTTGTFSARRR